VRGSSPGGCSGAGRAGVSCPRRIGRSLEWRKGAAVVFGARGVGREKGSTEWNGHELEKLESRRIEARKGCSARAIAAARCRPAEALVAVALAEEDSRGGKQDRGRGRATRGVFPSRRWRRGGARAAVGGADSRRQSRGAEKQRGARGRRREGGPRDLFAKIEKSRDLTVN
jgi:hypothetical protein